MWRARVLFAIALLMSLTAAACTAQRRPTPTLTPEVIMASSGTPVSPRSAGSTAAPNAATPTPGAGLRLGEGSEQAEVLTPAPTVPAQPLSATEAQQVLNRLPPLQAGPEDQQAFALRPSSLPAPRPGQTIDLPFPPPTSAPAPDPAAAGPLEVLRYQPDGDVPLAPYLSVTFSQPMVALTGIQDLAQGDVPVKLSPVPAGKWRWVGTKTLMFEPSGRFPMATKYTATIPAGTKSATGGALAAAVTWTFTTPPPALQSSYPNGGPTRRDVLMFAAFDQRIEPNAVLGAAKVTAGGAAVKVRLATPDEVQADKTVSKMAESAGVGRWLAFKAIDLLPGDTNVSVTFPAGTPSAEGPLTTTPAQIFHIQDLRSTAGQGRALRVQRPVPAFRALVRRVQQSAG